jgi:hypothetical protein
MMGKSAPINLKKGEGVRKSYEFFRETLQFIFK